MKISLRPKAASPLMLALCLVAGGAFHVSSHAQEQTPATQEPIYLGNPWQLRPDAWLYPDVLLSPDGKYLATLCLRQGAEIPTPSPISHAVSPGEQDLVIWRLADQKEVARQPVDFRGSLQWSSASDVLAVRNSTTSLVWNWRQEKLVPFEAPENTDQSVSLRAFNPGNHVRLQQPYNDPSNLLAFNTETGAPIPVVAGAVRLLQDLPAQATKATSFESDRFALLPSSPQNVQLVYAREVIPPDDVPFSSNLRHASIARWNITTGTRLWEYRTSYAYFPPKISVSPDGLLIAVLGTASPDGNALQNGVRRVEDLPLDDLADNAIEILDATTGKRVSSLVLNHVEGDLNRGNVRWLRRGIESGLVVSDWRWIRNDNGPWPKQRLMRFFDPRTGRETQRSDLTKYWPFEPGDESERQIWSISADGQILALATVLSGTHVFHTATLPTAN